MPKVPTTHQVCFIHLDNPELYKKDQIICTRVAPLYALGKVVLIRIERERASALDRALWCEPVEDFLPHAILPCPPPYPPILLTTNDCIISGVDVLILATDQCDFTWCTQFPSVIDFAEVHDPMRRERSRERFKQWRGLGLTPEYDRQYANTGNTETDQGG